MAKPKQKMEYRGRMPPFNQVTDSRGREIDITKPVVVRVLDFIGPPPKHQRLYSERVVMIRLVEQRSEDRAWPLIFAEDTDAPENGGAYRYRGWTATGPQGALLRQAKAEAETD